MPAVTVVTPVYNRPAAVLRAIDSVRAQTFGDWEMIVVDDGSTDGTADAVAAHIEGDPRIRLVRLARNGGVSAARNAAIREARGEWIAVLDSDDVWVPGKLEKQLARVQSYVAEGHGTPGLVYCWSVILRPGVEHPQRDEPEGMVRDAALRRFFCLPSTWMIRTDAMRAVGMFDETMRAAEDCDFVLRFAEKYEFACVRENLVSIHRDGNDHLTNSPEWGEVLMARYARDFRRVGGRRHEALVWMFIGRLYFKLGRRPRAIRCALRMVRIHPAGLDGWRLLARTMLRPLPVDGVRPAATMPAETLQVTR